MTRPTAPHTFAERELDPSLREAAAAAPRGPEREGPTAEIERRERELARLADAVDAQRARLEAVRSEYEALRAALTRRAHDAETERDRLRTELGMASDIEGGRPAASPPPPPSSDYDGWVRPLGRPLDAA